MHAVSIEAGGIVPLPRVGGALSHAFVRLPALAQARGQRCQPLGKAAQGATDRGKGTIHLLSIETACIAPSFSLYQRVTGVHERRS